MKAISIWAKRHTALARVLIVVIHLLLGAIAFFVVSVLHFSGKVFPIRILYPTVTVFIVSALIHVYIGDKGSWDRNIRYIIRKTCDLILGSCSFVMLCSLAEGNISGAEGIFPFIDVVSVDASIGWKRSAADQGARSFMLPERNGYQKAGKSIMKKEWSARLMPLMKWVLKRDRGNLSKGLLIFLMVLLGLGLLLGLAALSCGIACSGGEFLAFVLFIFGITAIIWLVARIIQKISNRNKVITAAYAGDDAFVVERQKIPATGRNKGRQKFKEG